MVQNATTKKNKEQLAFLSTVIKTLSTKNTKIIKIKA